MYRVSKEKTPVVQRQAIPTSLTETEHQQLLVDWNATQTDYPRDICVHHIFEAQAKLTPNALAVISTDEQLTYGELNCRANRLAHVLQRYGITSGTIVGVYLEQSPLLIVTLLAIIKAGGAYLSLDYSAPTERIMRVLQDAHVPVVVTQTALKERFLGDKVSLLCLDEQTHLLTQMSEDNPTSAAVAEDPIYVIYTSGSVGTPKGVVIPHRAVNRTVLNTNYISILPTDRIAQASTVVFDAATFEIWGALLNGAQLVLLPKNVLLTPHIFAQYLRDERITILFITTALFNLMAYTVPDTFATLQYLLFGGEQVNPRSVRAVLKSGAPKHLLHMYGPTETTTFTTFYAVHHVDDDATTLPIGRPLSNTMLYVLNEQLEVVPVGDPGELYIGGDGLALGYLDSVLTAERFVPHPWDAESGKHLYRTGDVVTYQEDGNVVFIGRYDDQVKVSGYRIELGEIITQLSLHPEVQACAVIPKVNGFGEKRLVAYVVPRQGTNLTNRDLREYLKDRLPTYMVPANIMLLPSLPLNANGKLDKEALVALPEPESLAQTEPEVEHPPVDESNDSAAHELIEGIIRIYTQILGASDIQADTDFNESGGTSLATTLLTREIYHAYSVELSIRDILVNPTPREIATLITARQP